MKEWSFRLLSKRIMKKLWVLLAFLLLTSCSQISNQLYAIKQYSFTPAQAFTRLGDSRNVNNFKLMGIERAPDGKMVGVFTYQPNNPNQPREYTIGYAIAERMSLLHWGVTMQHHSHQTIPKRSIPIDYAILQEAYTAVFGPVFSEEVIAVEVKFSDGAEVREPIKDDHFLVFSAAGLDVCKIRAIGKDDKILSEAILSRWGSESDACYQKK